MGRPQNVVCVLHMYMHIPITRNPVFKFLDLPLSVIMSCAKIKSENYAFINYFDPMKL